MCVCCVQHLRRGNYHWLLQLSQKKASSWSKPELAPHQRVERTISNIFTLQATIDIIMQPASGVARTLQMLGHNMGTLRLYELLCKWGSIQVVWGMLHQKIFRSNFTASQVCSEAMSQCSVHHLYGKLAYSECTRLIILWILHSDTAPFDFKTVQHLICDRQ